MPCCKKFAQITLFIVNCIFFVIGVALIVLGSLILSKERAIVNEVGDIFKSSPILLLILGSITFVVATLGCCGAAKESRCLLYSYSACIAVLLLLQVSGIILYFTHRRHLSEYALHQTLSVFKHYNTTKEYRKMVDEVQVKFQCCGSESFSDYKIHRINNGTIPDSCCPGKACNNDNSNVFKQGCALALVRFLTDNAAVMISTLVIEMLIQVLAIVMACFVVRENAEAYKSFPK
jgi:CD63 antigen